MLTGTGGTFAGAGIVVIQAVIAVVCLAAAAVSIAYARSQRRICKNRTDQLKEQEEKVRQMKDALASAESANRAKSMHKSP